MEENIKALTHLHAKLLLYLNLKKKDKKKDNSNNIMKSNKGY